MKSRQGLNNNIGSLYLKRLTILGEIRSVERNEIMKVRMFILSVLFSSSCFALDYTDVKVTGYGLSQNDSNYIRFTIDKDPNVIIRTVDYSGEQQKIITSMILSAYATQSTIAFLRTSESSSSSSKHYTDLVMFGVGEIQHD